MPVTSTHPEYQANIDLWTKCRTVLAGEEAVKAAGVLYLPMLEGQSAQEYYAYKMRAMFYAATGRTVKSLVGAILRKDPDVKSTPVMENEVLDDVGAKGESIYQVTREVLCEVIGIGRVGVLVDTPEDIENGLPYVTIYYAENITSWRNELLNGKDTLVRVVLRETVEVIDEKDPFVIKTETRYRVLRLGFPKDTGGEEVTSENGDPVYFVEIWVKIEKKDQRGGTEEDWILDHVIVPKRPGGTTLDQIPFTFISPEGLDSDVERSPVLDLVNVNLSHYRTSADLEHGRHFTALPTAWVAGFDPKSTNLKIGSSVAWVTENTAGKAGFLEFTGAGLASLSQALQEKQQLMAVLGARLLEEQKKDSEAAETVRLRHAGEQSVLADISDSCSEGMTRVLELIALWLNTPDADVSMELNKDFNLLGVDPQMLTALMAGVQSNLVSWSVFFYNMQRGELYPDNLTPEEEADLIKAGPPMPAPAAPGFNQGQDFPGPSGEASLPQPGAPEGAPAPPRQRPGQGRVGDFNPPARVAAT